MSAHPFDPYSRDELITLLRNYEATIRLLVIEKQELASARDSINIRLNEMIAIRSAQEAHIAELDEALHRESLTPVPFISVGL